MRILTPLESSLRLDLLQRGPQTSAWIPTPFDSGRKAHLAKALCKIFENRSTLVMVSDQMVWQPAENETTFARFINGCGSEYDPDAIYRCEADEGDVLFGLISLAAFFVWTVCVVSDDESETCVLLSHDEVMGWIVVE